MPTKLQTSPEQPAPVRQIATLVAGWVDRLGAVWVAGQIAQLNRRPGTVFMTLRDPLADMSILVTCNKLVLDASDPPVVEGASVVVHGRPRFYANRGSLSLVADEIRTVGLGELLARIERRRQLLAAEGLFAAERKKRLPFLPGVIGVVTAQGSAAERDVVENARRRWPAVRFEPAYAAMQGSYCAREVIDAVQRLDRTPGVEVIVIARGGGSVEDLLPFSDEGVVRAVAAARTPVVSAIGHEQDTPILDLVADVRASTPTDAAKLLVPDMSEELHGVAQARERMRRHVAGMVQRELDRLATLRERPCLADPHTMVTLRERDLGELTARIRRCHRDRLDRGLDDVTHARARVRALSPLETLRRGYAVLQTPEGHVVSHVDEGRRGDLLTARVSDGRMTVRVEDLQTDSPSNDEQHEEVR